MSVGQIELILASAGSGKTHRLVTLLEEALTSGVARPEAVLATTFTTRAAAELAERVSERLVAVGRVDLSRRIAGARIGTVNSVASQLVSDFALELGISPFLRVLDAKESRVRQAQTITAVVTEEELDQLQDLRTRLVAFEWTEAVASAIDVARANCLTGDDLRSAPSRSLNRFLSVLDEPVDASALDAQLRVALDAFLGNVDPGADPTQATARAVVLAREALLDLARGRLPWARWLSLSELAPGAESRDIAQQVRIAAARFLAHPRLRNDLERATQLVFDLAGRTLTAYERANESAGYIDFVDQERLALKLLSAPELTDAVRDRLELDLVLVDEFQDTSPLQLAVFSRLAAWSHRSVWVGDPKQAIYGFRGTDPALVEACIASLPGRVEVLGKSWRSRPGLVRLTSAVFVPPFESHGLVADRVRLEPAVPTEPPGLGPFVERWRLPSSDRASDVIALASAVTKLLSDNTVRVRGEESAVRSAAAGDVAILCRTNAVCRAVADALVARGVPATADRPGLFGTAEARLITAGLRVWRDPDDTLALAELGRLLDEDATGSAWLEGLLARGPGTFARTPAIAALLADREGRRCFGVTEAVDAVIAALDVRGLALAWGHSSGRLANVEAIRCEARAFESEPGATPTIAGFLDHADSLAETGEDWHGEPEGSSAVTVCTWHAAKGLEWPIVVLFELDSMKTGVPLEIRVDSSSQPSLEEPLRGRSVRYWPSPFLRQQSVGAFFDRLAATPEGREAAARVRAEELRLLYVAWTRARDRLVLAARNDKLGTGILSLLEAKGRPLVFEPLLRTVTWAGQKLELAVREGSLKAVPRVPPLPGEGFAKVAARTYPPAFERPSELVGRGAVVRLEPLGDPIVPAGAPSPDLLGTAVHGFFAGDDARRERTERRRSAQAWLDVYEVGAAITPDALVAAADALYSALGQRFPGGQLSSEVPVSVRQSCGTLLRGAVDLVVETTSGLGVLDHKAFVGSRDDCVDHARDAFGQLAAYGSVLAEATGLPITGYFVHLPLAGVLVELRADSSPDASSQKVS